MDQNSQTPSFTNSPTSLKEQKIKWDRKFLGKTEGFVDEEEKKLERKHYKAYKRGDKQFKYGKKPILDKFGQLDYYEDIWHPVKEELKIRE